jgi:hypothetical protein
MLLQSSGRANALRTLLKTEQERGPDFLRLANALSALYPAGSEEKRLLEFRSVILGQLGEPRLLAAIDTDSKLTWYRAWKQIYAKLSKTLVCKTKFKSRRVDYREPGGRADAGRCGEQYPLGTRVQVSMEEGVFARRRVDRHVRARHRCPATHEF